ncbi:hypothetical protein [Aestuariivita boseongensis]|uniref:hypothetical protein n=1 Tax=Aestuariivita boseongensis TaxID=1470562 RepID=UPI00067FC230|nr:hypothetical protein [Aestuariivita boseongensis]
MRVAMITAIFASLASPALADFAKIADENQFVEVVNGKTLTRPLVQLEVSPTGQISGQGASWPVTGNWSWRDGYFCRDLDWGGTDLGYNCQEVRVFNDRIRFTSDRGAGQSAVFRLR